MVAVGDPLGEFLLFVGLLVFIAIGLLRIAVGQSLLNCPQPIVTPSPATIEIEPSKTQSNIPDEGKMTTWDIGWGYGVSGAFAFWFLLSIVAGPDILVMLVGGLLFLSLVIVFCILTSRLPYPRRGLPWSLVLLCLIAFFAIDTVDLHLIGRIYLAGGPKEFSRWAQELIQDPKGSIEEKSKRVKLDRIPRSVQRFLSPSVRVGDTLWSDTVQVRIELGGGFYHYGVAVYPRDETLSSKWWQRVLGWPPEVVIYHEE